MTSLPLRSLRSLAFVVVLGLALTGHATSLELDPNFAPAALFEKSELGTSEFGNISQRDAFHALPDGRVIVVGRFTHLNGHPRAGVGILTAQGTTDLSFNPSATPFPGKRYSYSDLKPLANGRFLAFVGISETLENGSIRYRDGLIIRLQPDGSIDTSYTPMGMTMSNGGRLMALPGNQVLGVRGEGPIAIAPFPQSTEPRLRRFDANGNIDPGFTVDEIQTPITTAREFIAPTPDGGLVAVVSSSAGRELRRLSASGSLDAAFHPVTPSVSAIAAQPDGAVLVGGNNEPFLVRYRTDGTLDSTFAPVIPNLRGVQKIRTLSGGRVAVEARVGSNPLGSLATMRTQTFILDASGQLMRDLRDVLGIGQSSLLAAAQPDGRLLVVAGAQSFQREPLVNYFTVLSFRGARLLRVSGDGALDVGFQPAVTSRRIPTRLTPTLDDAGRMLISGPFTELAGEQRFWLARLLSDGALDLGFKAAARDATSRQLVLVQGDGRPVVSETALGAAQRDEVVEETTRMARLLSSDGSLDTSFAPDAELTSNLGLWEDRTSGGFIGMRFEGGEIPFESNFRLVRYSAQGKRVANLATTFSDLLVFSFIPESPPASPVFALQSLMDGRLLLVVGCRRVNGVAVNGVVRLLPSGELDPTYAPALSAYRFSENLFLRTRFHADGRALVSGQSFRYGYEETITVRLTTEGAVDGTFSAPANEPLLSFAKIMRDGTLFDGALRWLADGRRDIGFVAPVVREPTGGGTDFRYDGDTQGRIYLAGEIATVNGQPRSGLARLIPISRPGILASPKNLSVVAGDPAEFNVALGGDGAATYQWYFNGAALPGSTDPVLRLPEVKVSDAGGYSVRVTQQGATYVSAEAMLAVRAATTRLINISALTTVGAGLPTPIIGFYSASASSRPVLIRAVGYGLPTSVRSERVPAPKLHLYGQNAVVAEDFGGAARPDIAQHAREVGAFSLSTSALPFGAVYGSAIWTELSGGLYSVLTSSLTGGTGVCLTELYDGASTSVASAAFSNVSMRGGASASGGALTAGFVLLGEGRRRVLIRGAGPALSAFGVPTPVNDPRLSLFVSSPGNPSQRVEENDDWGTPAASAALIAQASIRAGAFAFAAGSRDAAMIVALAPGAYTAQLSAAPGTAGEGLIEVYLLDP